jgi:hypothetical protein
MCLAHRCVATNAVLTTENTALLLLPAFASAGMCLPSHCLAVNYSSFQAHVTIWFMLDVTPGHYILMVRELQYEKIF